MKLDGLLAPLHLDLMPGLISLQARPPGVSGLANYGDRKQFIYARQARGLRSLRDYDNGPFLCRLPESIIDTVSAVHGAPGAANRTVDDYPEVCQAAIRGMQAGFELGVQAAREQMEELLATMGGRA